jgi:GrpB-like predicted nucleotidyltransferase (UPF0157 family)
MSSFIEPYNPEWKINFERIRHCLQAALHDLDIDVQHVGSTSIPGLVAKPILDIDIIIKDETVLKTIATRLENLGYKNEGEKGIPGRFAFKQPSTQVPFSNSEQQWQQHHLYVCLANSLALKNHLLMRDALRHDQSLSDEYALLKKQLMREKGMTRADYTKRKTVFLLKVLAVKGLSEAELDQIRKDNS